MAVPGALPFVLDRHFEALYGGSEDRRLTMAICTHWPNLDPVEVSAWPWHRTRFYLEWLGEIAKAEPDDEGADGPAAGGNGATLTGVAALDSLASFPGVQVRRI